MEFRLARTRDELEEAFALVHREYLKRGYADDAEGRLRLIPHIALPLTAVFVGLSDDGRIAATATVVPDTPLGLPLDGTYPVETDGLRARGRLCEVSLLASRLASNPGEASPVLFSFFKILLDYATAALKADFLCVAVHPRHAAAFDALLFEPFGGQKPYRGANNAPSVALFLDLRSLPARLLEPGRETIRVVFGAPAPDGFEGRYRLQPGDWEYFFGDGRKPSSLRSGAERAAARSGAGHDAADEAAAGETEP